MTLNLATLFIQFKESIIPVGQAVCKSKWANAFLKLAIDMVRTKLLVGECGRDG